MSKQTAVNWICNLLIKNPFISFKYTLQELKSQFKKIK